MTTPTTPQQKDNGADAERILDIAHWLDSQVNYQGGSPEEPPQPGTEFDYNLAQAASELIGIARGLAAPVGTNVAATVTEELIYTWINGIGGGIWKNGSLTLRRDELVAAIRGIVNLAAGAPAETAGAVLYVRQMDLDSRHETIIAAPTADGKWVVPLYLAVPQIDATTAPASQAVSSEAADPSDIRAAGWAVAVHNDYRLNGEAHTFWLFTKEGRAVKGEGRTDAEALAQVRAEIATNAAAQASTPATPDGDDSLNICLSDLEHSSIYDNPREMVACMKAVIARIRALPIVTPATPSADVVKDAARLALQKIIDCVPAQNSECGGFFVEHYGPDGEYLGAQQINPDDIIQEMQSIAVAAMGALPPESKGSL